MAEQDRPDPRPDEQQVEGVDEQSEKPAGDTEKNPRTFIQIALLSLTVLIGLSGGVWITYDQYQLVDRAVGAVGETASSMLGGGKKPKYGQFKKIENLIVNPRGSNGQRYLMVALGLESHSAAALEEVSSKEVVVRDTVLKILGQYTVKQLSSLHSRDTSKAQIRRALNDIISKGKIDRLYYTQYVLQ